MSTTDENAGWVELDDHCVVSFKGTATRGFLGRQLTCDINELTTANPLFGAWLTPKGRVLVLLRLLDKGADHIDAVMPAALVDEAVRRMRMFVMRDDVTIEIDANQSIVGVWGNCVNTLEQVLSPASASGLIRLASTPALAMLVCPRTDANQHTAKLATSQGSAAGDVMQWQHMCIEAGVPQVQLTTREAFIPQMINLDRLDAVSFSKGCYPGQEIVARTQHLGRIKRRMFITRTASGTLLKDIQPGDVIVSADGADIGGRVVCVESTADHTAMLAVLPINADTSSKRVRIHDADGAILDVFAPPYSLADPTA